MPNPSQVEVAAERANPSLWLDKWHPLAGSDPSSGKILAAVCKGTGDFARSRVQRDAIVKMLGSRPHRKEVLSTIGPIALHLARATALENACLAMHPVYAIPYLPATGLKGVARKYAEDCAQAPKAIVDRIFGRRLEDSESEAAGNAGSVIFYDALVADEKSCGMKTVDIVNNHHSGYYSGSTSHFEDTEDPVPVFFLSLRKGASFEFCLGSRAGASQADVDQAWEWLRFGLVHLGVGAKTNSGYGRFDSASDEKFNRLSRKFRLELMSPAFLAGAGQGAEDCQLRGATLRGILRWWWRAAFGRKMGKDSFRELEGALWGTASREGAIGLVLRETGVATPKRWENFPKVARGEANRRYLAYGMEENRGKAARWYLDVGARWEVEFVARPTNALNRSLSAEDVMLHAVNCLGLLCEFGGMGAKSRKGFGSVSGNAKVEDFFKWVDSYKNAEAPLAGPSLFQNRSKQVALNLPQTATALEALDIVAAAYNSIDKKSREYGLPRTGVKESGKDALNRCSSPLHIKLVKTKTGYAAKILVLPTPSINSVGINDTEPEKRAPFRAIQEFERFIQERSNT